MGRRAARLSWDDYSKLVTDVSRIIAEAPQELSIRKRNIKPVFSSTILHELRHDPKWAAITTNQVLRAMAIAQKKVVTRGRDFFDERKPPIKPFGEFTLGCGIRHHPSRVEDPYEANAGNSIPKLLGMRGQTIGYFATAEEAENAYMTTYIRAIRAKFGVDVVRNYKGVELMLSLRASSGYSHVKYDGRIGVATKWHARTPVDFESQLKGENLGHHHTREEAALAVALYTRDMIAHGFDEAMRRHKVRAAGLKEANDKSKAEARGLLTEVDGLKLALQPDSYS
jgi:hypothetical protein